LRSITPGTQKPFGVIRASHQENQLALWDGHTALLPVLPFQALPLIPFFDVSAGRPVTFYFTIGLYHKWIFAQRNLYLFKHAMI
jgi:hypothetical protein